MAWQKAHEHGKRPHAATAVYRLKRNGGDRLKARAFGAQQKGVALRISATNKVIRQAKPVTVRVA
ncbi:MAG: hypothetical protein AAF968_24925 [Pseudomonadota bacterium]